MSLPRQVLPNRSYMITRRCTQRQFLLRPDPAINNAFIYCLAEAAQVHRIDILFAIAMSNHVHVGRHDAEGNYPLFIERFHKHLAKCVNAMRGRWENVFSAEQTSVVRLTEPNDVIDKMAYYAHANPCAADLVEHASQWPGVSSIDAIIHGRSMTASRPSRFFRADGPMPRSVSLTFARAPGFENLTHEAFVARVKDALEGKERTAAAIRLVAHKRVMGVQAILAQRWQHSPATKEPRRKISPTIAAKQQVGQDRSAATQTRFPAGICRRSGFVSGTGCRGSVSSGHLGHAQVCHHRRRRRRLGCPRPCPVTAAVGGRGWTSSKAGGSASPKGKLRRPGGLFDVSAPDGLPVSSILKGRRLVLGRLSIRRCSAKPFRFAEISVVFRM